jgi:hypothetical protein
LHFEDSLVIQDILVFPSIQIIIRRKDLGYGVCGVLLKGRLFAVRGRSEADS